MTDQNFLSMFISLEFPCLCVAVLVKFTSIRCRKVFSVDMAEIIADSDLCIKINLENSSDCDSKYVVDRSVRFLCKQ
jgi:hypothetical protein